MKHAMKCADIAVLFIFVLGISCAALAAAPQSSRQSSQSVADAARKAQEKQKDAPKAKSVWTNDNIPSTPGEVSIVGQSSSATSEAGSTDAAPAPANASASSDADRAKVSSELDDAQKQLDSLKTDLDILQREYNLDAAQLYSTPDYSKNQQGQAKVDVEKAAIAGKQQAVDAAQKKVDDLDKQLKSLGEKPKPPPTAPASAAPSLKPGNFLATAIRIRTAFRCRNS
ncbi:MAG: hypothetical protein ACRD4H_00425 [Candidatus Acidiferrales bacterium]